MPQTCFLWNDPFISICIQHTLFTGIIKHDEIVKIRNRDIHKKNAGILAYWHTGIPAYRRVTLISPSRAPAAICPQRFQQDEKISEVNTAASYHLPGHPVSG